MTQSIIRREFTLGNIIMFFALVFSSGINYATIISTQETHTKELDKAAKALSQTRADSQLIQQRLSDELRSLRDIVTQLQITNTTRFTRLETLIEREHKSASTLTPPR